MPSTFPIFTASFDHDLHLHWRARSCYTLLQTGDDNCQRLLHIWSAWQKQSDSGAAAPQQLHYLIVAPQLRAHLTSLPLLPSDCANLAQQLHAAWPPLVPGYHRLSFAQGRLVLTLIIGDVAQALTQLDAMVDCFVLDDTTVWTAALFQRLGRIATPNAHLCMLTPLERHASALQQAGFMLTGASVRFTPRWQAASPPSPPAMLGARHAIVIGAGLAGSAACERLTARGWQVTLLEQHGQPAQEASGNLAGVYMPSISRDDNPSARLTRAAFLFAQQVWRQLGVFAPERSIGEACGVLQLARDAVQAKVFEQAARHWQYPFDYAQWLSADAVSMLLGMRAGSGWLFPGGGWLRPAALCAHLLQACGTRLQQRFDCHVAQLRRVGDDWQVADATGTILAQAPVLILANAIQALRFEQAAGLPLQMLRGQVSHVPSAQLPPLPVALCGDGYLTGAVDGLISLGASYDRDDDGCLRLDSHIGNLTKLRHMLPQWHADVDPSGWGGRVGFRCVAADRLPLVGALPDIVALAQAGEVRLSNVPRHPHLYSLLGYASRGLIWAPLSAEIVACRLTGEAAPLSKDMLALLDPARFALQAHRRE